MKLTKRSVLSHIARIYDPIGIAAAYVIPAKIGMEKLWLEGLNWDEELPPDSQTACTKFFQEMKELNNAMIERSLTPDKDISAPSLIIFADASKEAFGTCAYMRWKSCDQSFITRFVSAKS